MSGVSDFRRRFRATSGRRRKLRGLAQLLSPYRWRVLAMLASLVIATGAALASQCLKSLRSVASCARYDFTVALSKSIFFPCAGFVAADNLSLQKARILLQLALSRTTKPDEIQQMFDEY